MFCSMNFLFVEQVEHIEVRHVLHKQGVFSRYAMHLTDQNDSSIPSDHWRPPLVTLETS